MKTEQKLILETDHFEFHRIVNGLLKNGWHVVPTTLVVSNNSYVIQSHNRAVEVGRYAVVLERSV